MSLPAKKYTVHFDALTDKIEHPNGKKYYLVPCEEVEKLLSDNITYKKEIDELRYCATSIIAMFGLLDEETGTIRQSIVDGTESYIKYVLKALNRMIADLAIASFSKTKEAEVAQRFAFIKTLIPIIQKYAASNGPKHQPAKPELPAAE